MQALLSRLGHRLAACRKAGLAIALIAAGWFARDAWTWMTRPDPYEALLYTSHAQFPSLPPHLVVPHSLIWEEDNDGQYDSWANGRTVLAFVALDEVFDIRGVLSGTASWNCVAFDYIGARKAMTLAQIKDKCPEFEAAYLSLEQKLEDFSDCADGYAALKYPNLHYANLCRVRAANLLARLAQYQIARGGKGGDAEFDLLAFKSAMDAEMEGIISYYQAEGQADRVALANEAKRELALAAARVGYELRNWDPKCARLVVECMHAHITYK